MRGSASSSQVFFRGILTSGQTRISNGDASSEGSRNWEIDELSNMIGHTILKIGNTFSQSLQRIKPVSIFFDPNFSIDRNIKFKKSAVSYLNFKAHFKRYIKEHLFIYQFFPIENLAYETLLRVTEIKSEFRCSIKERDWDSRNCLAWHEF